MFIHILFTSLSVHSCTMLNLGSMRVPTWYKFIILLYSNGEYVKGCQNERSNQVYTAYWLQMCT